MHISDKSQKKHRTQPKSNTCTVNSLSFRVMEEMDILDNVCQDPVRFVWPEGVSLEPGWPLHRFKGGVLAKCTPGCQAALPA